MDQELRIEVAYARPEKQWLLEITLPAESSIEDAILRSGILDLCPELSHTALSVGIYGKLRPLTHRVQHGDRIEIYRSLLKDPREARRERHEETRTSPRPRHPHPQKRH